MSAVTHCGAFLKISKDRPHIDYNFDPYVLDFDGVSGLVSKYDDFILKELGLQVKTEG